MGEKSLLFFIIQSGITDISKPVKRGHTKVWKQPSQASFHAGALRFPFITTEEEESGKSAPDQKQVSAYVTPHSAVSLKRPERKTNTSKLLKINFLKIPIVC